MGAASQEIYQIRRKFNVTWAHSAFKAERVLPQKWWNATTRLWDNWIALLRG
jgi:hypothetical protein